MTKKPDAKESLDRTQVKGSDNSGPPQTKGVDQESTFGQNKTAAGQETQSQEFDVEVSGDFGDSEGTLELSDLEARKKIDALANDFERQWTGPDSPRIEDFVEQNQGEVLPEVLIPELVRVEIDLRREKGDQAEMEEYLTRFPELNQALDTLVQGSGSFGLDDDAETELRDQKIGDYQVNDELGRGGMGVVYKAVDQKLNRTVALKMILASRHANREAIERFVSEARVVAKLQHPNIVQIFQIGDHNGDPYISLEFVDGDTLSQLMRDEPQTPKQAATMVATLAEAMHYAHDHQVVHRDLKPANIMLTQDGVPKISDFGLAKQLDEDMGKTRDGTIMGTPNYMSPEQAAGKSRDVGPASDQYSLGAILYRLLTGRPPFVGDKLHHLVKQVCNDEPLAPSQLDPSIPVDLETICIKALQKDEQARYASCAEMAADLQRYLNGEPILARPISGVERLWRWCKRNPRIAIPSFSAVVLLVIATCVSTYAYVAVSSKNEEISRKSDEISEQNVEIKNQNLEISAQNEVITKERDRANKNAETATRNEKEAKEKEKIARGQANLVVTSMQNVLTEIESKLAEDPALAGLRIDVLKSQAAVWDQIYDVVRKDKQSQTTPTLMAVRMKLATLFDQTGATEEAIAEMKKLHQMGLERIEVKKNSDASRRNMASICMTCGDMLETSKRDQQAALEMYEESLKWMQDIFENPNPGTEPGAPIQVFLKHLLAASHQRVGKALLMLGELEKAKKQFQQGYETRHELVQSFAQDKEFLEQPAAFQKALTAEILGSYDRSLLALGTILMALGEVDAGLDKIKQAWQLQKNRGAADGASVKAKWDFASFSGNYGFACLKVGRNEQGYQLLAEHSLPIFEQFETKYKEHLPIKRDHSLAHYRIGVACDLTGKPDAAEHFKRCRDLREAVVNKDPNNQRDRSMLMVAEARVGNWEKAVEMADEFDKQDNVDPKQHLERARAYAQASRHNEEQKTALLDQSLKALQAAIDQQYRDRFELEHEPDLIPVRERKEFSELVESIATPSSRGQK